MLTLARPIPYADHIMTKQSRARTPLLGFLLVLCGLSGRAAAQSFAVGAGASMVNDTGSVAEVRGFDTAGGHLFVEMALDPAGAGTAFQLRAAMFSLPPTAETGPNIKTEALTASVQYLFREDWFRGGFIGGIGVYRLTPKHLETGQVTVDPTESVFGWSGGLVAIFDLNRRIEFRLEATAALLKSKIEHRPIFLTGGVAYRF